MSAATERIALQAGLDPVAQLKMNQVVIPCPQCGERGVLHRQEPQPGHGQTSGATVTYSGTCSGCRSDLVVPITATPPAVADQLRTVKETLDRVLQHLHREGEARR